MKVSGKVWGQTVELEANPFMSFHRAEVRAGYRCSRHHHVAKWNGFFVESGEIDIRVYQPSGTEDVTTLRAGDYMSMAPGVEHRFESNAACVLFEIYWPATVADDIVRQDEGGLL